MKITNKSTRRMLSYGLIDKGQTFKRDSTGNLLFIRTDRLGASGALAISLADGVAYSWPDEADGFYLVDAEVIVNG